jgi:large conductance mechanosensitive channel
LFKEFRKFIMRGNVLDLAVAVIIGAAFNQIVTSLVNDIIMPPIGLILGKVNFTNLFIDLSPKPYSTLAQAKAAGAATINYGSFINTLINFLIIAFVVFLVVRQFNRFKRPAPVTAPTTKNCTYCMSEIHIEATRCPHCTAHLQKDESDESALAT